ncbi:hypothetical protein [Ochrobactrum sp. Marseille-Q0166]|uniref:hypothetical protein n=1 Tax=Ochrobactrum sp. Marseille-Q0166 TaxID=2761105 RepID=UPI00165519E2|nr:hypothetical protein [Ochrobactrum sp. Marseille-Q0166]MBC8718190.1 hypothetical protein [Ochrobactrum sp. Marseille-Q0166]
MAKKTITQAYGATLIVGGKDIAPGTPVPLPEDEANRIGALFGVVAAINEAVKPSRSQPAASQAASQLDLLAKAVEQAQQTFDAAKAALESETAGDEELKAFEAAEAALNVAENAYQDAQG